jgi:hypothetical protein
VAARAGVLQFVEVRLGLNVERDARPSAFPGVGSERALEGASVASAPTVYRIWFQKESAVCAGGAKLCLPRKR